VGVPIFRFAAACIPVGGGAHIFLSSFNRQELSHVFCPVDSRSYRRVDGHQRSNGGLTMSQTEKTIIDHQGSNKWLYAVCGFIAGVAGTVAAAFLFDETSSGASSSALPLDEVAADNGEPEEGPNVEAEKASGSGEGRSDTQETAERQETSPL
jgi:hypothetical protein